MVRGIDIGNSHHKEAIGNEGSVDVEDLLLRMRRTCHLMKGLRADHNFLEDHLSGFERFSRSQLELVCYILEMTD